MCRRALVIRMGILPLLLAGSVSVCPAQEGAAAFVKQFCVDCHNAGDKTAGLALDALSAEEVTRHPESWEKVVRRLNARQMPPAEAQRPSETEYEAALSALTGELDRAAAARPHPGRTGTFRRLTRTEYQNAIRDLLVLEIDAAALLPPDESSRGFDNITVGDLSPTLLDRYISAAQKISRLAVGSVRRVPDSETVRLPPDRTQEEHVAGLPLGTRGGTLVPYTFPLAGEYEIQLRLTRDRNEHVEGLSEPHTLEVLLDRKLVGEFTVKPPAGNDHAHVDDHLRVRFTAPAGRHDIGVTFIKQASSLLETKRQPHAARFNMHRHPRLSPALFQVSVTGPVQVQETTDSPSRQRLFVRRPLMSEGKASDEESCATEILRTLVRRAYRRPVTDADLEQPLKLYREGRGEAGFEAGIEMALASVLVNPQFLFRIETDPEGLAVGEAYRVSNWELASRLSFFLWSSIPDDELLAAAERGTLHQPDEMKRQVLRMLADERAQNLTTNFASQWLHLRNLDSITPDLRLFPDFDDNLRQSLRQETELFVGSVLREDRSVLDLLQADFTFLNQRLAKHYGIPHVYGSRFRRVQLDPASQRGGLLRQGSVLTVTSYATRTSPVIRGKWVLENILGTPPPPPPADVPALKDNTVAANLSVRARLAEHRANAACASCHNLMDPVGFALENFDAVGRWRAVEEGEPVDSQGGLPDGSQFAGVAGLERALLARPEVFVGTLTEKLLTFALGRVVEHHDAPAIRQIVRNAAADDYRFSALIAGIAASTPFQMRKAE